jgi:hypothetical protein
MPKLRHEAVIEILQNEPALVLHLLRYLGVRLRIGSQATVTRADTNLSDRYATGDELVSGLFSDSVFVFESMGRKIAVIAEVQTGRPDADRAFSWPAYIINARRQHRCDTLLMIFAITKGAARGSAKVIPTGHPGWDLAPLISGIGKIPGIPEKGAQYGAELVLLRVITRELTLNTHDARVFALAAILSAAPQRRRRYTGYLKALAPQSVRKSLETLMKTVFEDPWLDGLEEEANRRATRRVTRQVTQQVTRQVTRQVTQEVTQEVTQQIALRLLDKRFHVPDDIRERVEACTDAGELNTWLDRVVTATCLDEVFAE